MTRTIEGIRELCFDDPTYISVIKRIKKEYILEFKFATTYADAWASAARALTLSLQEGRGWR